MPTLVGLEPELEAVEVDFLAPVVASIPESGPGPVAGVAALEWARVPVPVRVRVLVSVWVLVPVGPPGKVRQLQNVLELLKLLRALAPLECVVEQIQITTAPEASVQLERGNH